MWARARAQGKLVDEQVEHQLKARISIAEGEVVGDRGQVRESIGRQTPAGFFVSRRSAGVRAKALCKAVDALRPADGPQLHRDELLHRRAIGGSPEIAALGAPTAGSERSSPGCIRARAVVPADDRIRRGAGTEPAIASATRESPLPSGARAVTHDRSRHASAGPRIARCAHLASSRGGLVARRRRCFPRGACLAHGSAIGRKRQPDQECRNGDIAEARCRHPRARTPASQTTLLLRPAESVGGANHV